MKWFSKAAVGGLLWLSFTAITFGNTIYFTGQTENIEGGGQFTADLSSNPTQTFYTYCVDDLNYVAITTPPTGYSVNVITLSNSGLVAADTRYGQTANSSFTIAAPVDNAPNPSAGTAAATAQDRYAMAAWLIEQYSFPITGVNANTNDEIQNAIWSLLDATGATYSTCATLSNSACTTGTSAEISAAQSWFNAQLTAGTLTAFENNVVVYSATSIAGTSDPARYNVGNQEMIGITGAPEPGTLAMLGAGLLCVGLLGKKLQRS